MREINCNEKTKTKCGAPHYLVQRLNAELLKNYFTINDYKSI